MAKSKRSHVKKQHRKIKSEGLSQVECDRINTMTDTMMRSIGDQDVTMQPIVPLSVNAKTTALAMKSQLVKRFKKSNPGAVKLQRKKKGKGKKK